MNSYIMRTGFGKSASKTSFHKSAKKKALLIWLIHSGC